MEKNSKTWRLLFFFGISFVYSLIIFYSITKLLTTPGPDKTFSDYLPLYQSLFSNKTNDLPIYLTGVLSFILIPIFIYLLGKFLKYGLWLILLATSFIFWNNTIEIFNLINTNVPKDLFMVLQLIILSMVIGFALKKWHSVYPSAFKLQECIPNEALILEGQSDNIGNPKPHLKATVGIYHFFAKSKRSGINWFIRLKQPKSLIYLIAFIFIFILIYNPKYKYSYEYLGWYGREFYQQFHHVNFFLAPINEVLNGKTLLINADSQYGLFTIYLPALFFKFIGISYVNFVLYNMIVNIIYAGLFFFFLKIITRSFLIALIGTTVFIKMALFRYGPSWEAYTLPSTTPLRYFFDILAPILIYDFFKHKFSSSRLFFTSSIIVTSFFYNPEFGLPISIAYIFCLLTDVITTFIKNKKQSLDKLLKYVLSLELAIIFLIGTISFITYLIAGTWPNWGSYLSQVFLYSKGFADISMPIFDYYYLPLFIYLAAYYFILAKFYFKNFINIQLIVFLLTYGVMIFIYYVNLNESNHLFTVIHPAILIFFILLTEFSRDVRRILSNHSQALITIIVSFFVLVALSAFKPFPNPLREIIQKLQYRYGPVTKKYYHWPYNGAGFYLQDNNGTDFKLAVDKIQELTPNTKDIFIVSRYDSLLYVMSGKTSLINHPILEYEVRTGSAIKETIETIIQKKPAFIFLYSSKYNQMEVEVIEIIASALKKYYSFDSAAGVVDVYKRI